MLFDLSGTPFAEALRTLGAERRSGDLQVRSGKVVKALAFDHGRVVFAASNLRKDRLGEALLDLGRITDEQFQAATAVVIKDRTKRFGEALVQTRVLDKQEVGGSVARQVKRIVLSLFPLDEGVATFDERPCAVPLEYMVSLSIHRLLYDGIKTMTSEALVHAGLGDLDRRVKLGEVSPFEYDPKEADREEKGMLEQAHRRVTLRRLAWAPGGVSFDRLRTAYALVASGFLVDADRAEHAQPLIQMETGTFLLSALRHRPDPSAREAIHREVAQELDHSARLDREAWLKVSRTAPRDELIRALEEKAERYHALLDAVGDDKALKMDLEVILGRVSAMLRLSRQAAAPQKPAEAKAPASPPEPAAAPAPTATAPAPPAPSPAERPMEVGGQQLEHLLLEAEVRMTVSDYANAIRVLQRAVSLAPNSAGVRARLAIALASYPRTTKQAEREFVEATRLEPENADLHYQLGVYYKVMKQKARAIAELKTALRLNPRHALARRELQAVSTETRGVTIDLKKLFR